MTEQSGQQDPADRPPRESTVRGDRSGRAGQSRPQQNLPGSELLTDFQRWLLRSSAKSMRKELTGQVRKTLGGNSGRQDAGDVWDAATTEIPPEVGEAPECLWCPVCRAAKRMRDSGPGLGGQLSGAGDVVASAAADVVSMIDSFLARASGSAAQRERDVARDRAPPRAAAPAETRPGPAESGPAESGPADAHSGPAGGAADGAAPDGTEVPGWAPPDWKPAGWEPAAPVISAADAEQDSWGEATAAGDTTAADSNGGPAGPSHESAHEPDDRG